MVLGTARSINGVPVRLTEERWEHTLDRHAEFSYGDYDLVLEAVGDPEYILPGYGGAKIVVVVLGRGSYLHVLYRGLGAKDGFIITARISPTLDRKKILWRR